MEFVSAITLLLVPTGLYEVIPQPLLSIFDHREFELLLCGLPKLDVEDWKANTEYSQGFSKKHKVLTD